MDFGSMGWGSDGFFSREEDGSRIRQMEQIFTDEICVHPSNQFTPCPILLAGKVSNHNSIITPTLGIGVPVSALNDFNL